MKKAISLLLSLSLLFSSAAPALAEGTPQAEKARISYALGKWDLAVRNAFFTAQKNRNQLYQTQPYLLAKTAVQATYKKELAQAQQAPDLAHVFMDKMLDQCGKEIYDTGGLTDGKLAEKKICKGAFCHAAFLYGQACLDVALQQGIQVQNPVLDASYDVYALKDKGLTFRVPRLVKMVGASAEGADKVYEYLSGILRNRDVCTQADKSQEFDIKQPKASQCKAAMEAVEGVAVLGQMYPSRFSARAADDIYHFVNAKKRKPLGSAVVYQGVLALMGLNTEYSYRLLEEFLTQESKPTFGGTLLQELGAFTFEGVGEVTHARQADGHYLNSYTMRFSYLDEDLAQKWGFGKSCQRIENAVNQVQNNYQCPQGNLYEDIGHVIARDLQNPLSVSLANKIWQNSQDTHYFGRYPSPLIFGLLTGAEGAWSKKYGGAQAKEQLMQMLSQDFADMNEGTLRRRKYYAAQALEQLQKENLTQKYQVRDEEKFERYQKQQWHREVLGAADLVVASVLCAKLLFSLGSLGVQGVKAFQKVRHLRKFKNTAAALPKQAPVTAVNAAPAPAQAAASDVQIVKGAEGTAVWVLPGQEAAGGVLARPAQIAATGEASTEITLSSAKANQQIRFVQDQVARFSPTDEALFNEIFRTDMARAFSAARAQGVQLSVIEREKVYYKAYQAVLQAQQEALNTARLDVLANEMLSGTRGSGKVIRHIPWKVRFQVQAESLWRNIKAGVTGMTDNLQSMTAFTSSVLVGNPLFLTSTTQVGSAWAGLRSPIAIVADYSAGMGGKLTTLRPLTSKAALAAERNAAVASTLGYMARGTSVGRLSAPVRIESAMKLSPYLLPGGVAGFSEGAFKRRQVRSAFEKEPLAAARYFGVLRDVSARVVPTRQMLYLYQQGREINAYRTAGKFNITDFDKLWRSDDLWDEWGDKMLALSLSQASSDLVKKSYEQAAAQFKERKVVNFSALFAHALRQNLGDKPQDLAIALQGLDFEPMLPAPAFSLKDLKYSAETDGKASRQDWIDFILYTHQQMQHLVDAWYGVAQFSIYDLFHDPALAAAAMQDAIRYNDLEEELISAKKHYGIYFSSAEDLQIWPELNIYERLNIFSFHNRLHMTEKYVSDIQEKLKAEKNDKDGVKKELKKYVDLYDKFYLMAIQSFEGFTLPLASRLRMRVHRMKELQTFTALQQKEIADIEDALYTTLDITSTQNFLLTNRLKSLPYVNELPNTTFLLASSFRYDEAWQRKTMFGFSNFNFLYGKSLADAMASFVPKEENVLLIHTHGGINKYGFWKGPLITRPNQEKAIYAMSAQDLLEQVDASGSAHTSVYINACFSGKLLDDVQRLQEENPNLGKNMDLFTTAALYQRSYPEDLPTTSVIGTARQKLFDKMLLRMKHNGDGIGGRALVDGKLIYPLGVAVSRLEEKMVTGQDVTEEMIELWEDLFLLQNIADADHPHDLHHAIGAFELKHPDLVQYLGSDPKVTKQKYNEYMWGFGFEHVRGMDERFPYIQLKHEWVDHVAGVAQELFDQAAEK
ncbi:hypothetical protein [Candidatus Avelusimicrobium sp.]